MESESHEALYYEKLDDSLVRCVLCPHSCVIKPGGVGVCRQRLNDGGTLISRIYGRVTSVAMDPIEKKPLYHFHPGRTILSIGTNGCNFACLFCQNWSTSQQDAYTRLLSPRQAVRLAKENDSFGIAYTYNEPLIWYEFVLDAARLARAEGLKNVLVTNGFVQPEPLAELLPFIDALNIDIKSIRDEFYREICRGRLEPVLETAKAAKKVSHVEITNLIIPTHNDSDEDLGALAAWISENLGPDTPTHLSAYFPAHRLNAPPTPPETLLRALGIFSAQLDHVYLGNTSLPDASDTHCVKCGAPVIKRRGWNTHITGLVGRACAQCGEELNIVVC